MVYCCAINCNNRLSSQKRLAEGITFHSFPRDEERKKKWINNIRRDFFTPTAHTKICSQHFEQKMFDRTGQTTRLRPDAVPTLFDFPLHLKKESKQRAPPKERAETSRTPPSFAACSSVDVFNPGPCTFLDSADPQPPIAVESDICNDHSYFTHESPRKMKRKVDNLLGQNEQLRKKMNKEQTKCCKLKKKVESLQSVVNTLKQKHLVSLVSLQCAHLLDSTFSGVPKDLLKKMLEKGKTYSPELKAFAMTLSFYSAKAYRFVRKTFDLNLPHPAVLRRWYSAISGEPGFTKEVMVALKAKVLSARRNKEELVCDLVMDEMAIKKHVEWDGKKFRGFVDLGTGVDNDSVPPASNALVVMVVGLNGGWKVPCGYFLIDSLSGEEKANLIQTKTV